MILSRQEVSTRLERLARDLEDCGTRTRVTRARRKSAAQLGGRVGLLKRISGLCPAPAISKARYLPGAQGLGTASFLVSWPTTIKTIPQNGHVNDIQYFSAPFDYLLIAGEQK